MNPPLGFGWVIFSPIFFLSPFIHFPCGLDNHTPQMVSRTQRPTLHCPPQLAQTSFSLSILCPRFIFGSDLFCAISTPLTPHFCLPSCSLTPRISQSFGTSQVTVRPLFPVSPPLKRYGSAAALATSTHHIIKPLVSLFSEVNHSIGFQLSGRRPDLSPFRNPLFFPKGISSLGLTPIFFSGAGDYFLIRCLFL